MIRDLNYIKLTLCHLQTVATARGKVYQVNILWPVLVHLRVIVYQLAVRAKQKGGTRANPND